MNIEEVIEYTIEIHDALNNLLPQLSSSASPLSESDLREIISSESSHLLIAKDEDIYLGSLTLAVFRIPTGKRAWVEDVVVSESARGKGVGKKLLKHAVKLANSCEAKTIDLTSRPSRDAANALYKKAGFEMRETNVYRYKDEKCT